MIPAADMAGPTLLLAGGDPLHHNYDYPIISLPNGYAILTNHIVMMLTVFVLMLWLLPRAARAISTGKTGTSHDYVTKGVFAHLIEVLCVFFRDDVAKPALGKNTDKFMPFLWTVFFFILFNNLLGMVPLLDATSLLFDGMINGTHEAAAHVESPAAGEGHGEVDAHAAGQDDASHGSGDHEAASLAGGVSEESHESHAMRLGPLVLFQDLTKEGTASHFHGIGGTATGNIAVTFSLALIAIIIIISSGIKSLGFGGFIDHLTLGTKFPLSVVIAFLECVGLVAKPFALMVRLFANMTAGHVMLASVLGFCSMAWNGVGPAGGIVISVPAIIFATIIGILEVLVAFIQAFVFTFLTAMFISLFQHQEHGHEAGHEHDHLHNHEYALGDAQMVAAH